MDAGELRDRVWIETQAEVDGNSGKELAPWAAAEAHDRAAKVRPLRAYERLRAGEVAQATEFVVKMRYTPLVTPTCRLRWGAIYLYPSSVINVNSLNIELEILATTVEAHA